MKMYIANPDLRVFHLDHEAYIIYRGLSGKETRPFLRIGNSNKMPDELKSLTEWVVIPDSVVGDPTLERTRFDSLNDNHTCFIGDALQVGYYKDFVRQPDQPTKQYAIEEPVVREQGSILYFYRNGNLKIRFGSREIFNLERRRTNDQHYVVRTQCARRTFLRSPLRIATGDIHIPGFVVCNGVVYLFSSGRIGAISPKPGWFGDLGTYGIDPDLVYSAFAPDFDEGIFRYLQRMKLLSRSVRIVTSSRETVIKGMRLLWASLNEDSVEAVDTTTNESFDMCEMKINRINRQNGAVIQLGLRNESMLEIDPGQLIWHVKENNRNQPLIEGMPHRLFPKSQLSCMELIDRYVPNSPESYLGMLTTGECTFITQLRGALQKIDAKGAPAVAIISSMQNIQKRLHHQTSPLFALLLHNAIAIMRNLEAETDGQSSSALEQCMRIARGFDSHIRAQHYSPGVLADMRPTLVGVQAFYKISTALTQNNLSAAQSARHDIESDLAGRDNAYYQSELERLYVLLAELGLTKRRPQAAQQPAQSNADSGNALSEREAAAERARIYAQKRRARRNRAIAIAAAVVVLIGAGVVWQLSRIGIITLPVVGAVVDATANAENAPTSNAVVVEEPPTPRPEEAAEQVVIRETPTGILITLADIARLTNGIALLNGYREIGDFTSASPNPDFIYPGNLLTLPNTSVHTVVLGDNIWNLTADYIEDWLADRYGQYRVLIETDISTTVAREQLIEGLGALKDGSYSENFSALVDDTIDAARENAN